MGAEEEASREDFELSRANKKLAFENVVNTKLQSDAITAYENLRHVLLEEAGEKEKLDRELQNMALMLGVAASRQDKRKSKGRRSKGSRGSGKSLSSSSSESSQ